MIRKLLLGMSLALFALGAMANVDTSGLTDAQVAELKAKAAQIAADNARSGVRPAVKETTTVMTIAATWGQQAAAAAEGFAKALGIAAKELNVTINEFLASPAGKLTAAIIVWKVAGDSIVGLITAFMVLTVSLVMIRMIYTRLFTKEMKAVQYNYFWGMMSGTRLVRVPKSFSDFERDGEWLVFIIMLFGIVATLAVTGSLIV